MVGSTTASLDVTPRILVVEDERVIARDLTATLVELGYDPIAVVGTGEDAIRSARELAPDLVLMDIRLAGRLDGIAASAAIREELEIAVVFLTSHSDRETLRRATHTAPLGYLLKPFQPTELKCAIEVALYRQQVDAKLRERERWLATTLRSISDGVIATDSNDRVTLLNPVAELLTGWTATSALGRSIREVVAIVGDKPRLAVLCRDGGTTPIDNRVAPIVDDRGNTVGGVHVLRDVSVERRAEAQIVALNEQLEARVLSRTAQLEATNKELEAFNYSVAHDLRAPLRAIDRFSEALADDHGARLDPDALAHLHRIRAAAARMGSLIDDLLRLARVARRDLTLVDTDVSRLAREIVEILRNDNEPRQIEVRIADGLVAHTDPFLLRIVLDNLLRNAWKYTTKTDSPVIEVGASGSALFVRDNGVGFDMGYAGNLFGAFQRMHGEGEFEGNGVALAIVQRVVHRLGGQVWATAAVARPPRGTRLDPLARFGAGGRVRPFDADGREARQRLGRAGQPRRSRSPVLQERPRARRAVGIAARDAAHPLVLQACRRRPRTAGRGGCPRTSAGRNEPRDQDARCDRIRRRSSHGTGRGDRRVLRRR